MANKAGQTFALPKKSSLVAELFTTQEQRDEDKREKVQDIPLDSIDSFPAHPFQVKMDESMQAMADSVKAVGIQTPGVVRPKDDGRYEMVSGHRRKMACELAGLESMPCIVREMNRDEAIIIMVDSNLQREVILPSEMSKAYKMKLEAMKRQAGRPSKNNSAPLEPNLIGSRSNENLAEQAGTSVSQIKRYIRLTELIPQILDMVDSSQLALRTAVEISYLPSEQQQTLLDVIESEDSAPSHVQAVKIRKFFEEGSLNKDIILSIVQEDKPNQPKHFKLPQEKIRSFFPANTSARLIEETIIKALELWRNSNK